MPPPSLGGDNYPSDVTYGPTSYSENSSPREEVHCAPREIISDDRGTTIYLEAMVGQGAHGVVFRDIKPSNILCMYDNTYVLVDFGTFARISDSRISMTVGDCNWSEYAPPFDEELGESTESWSIGCVGVVLLVWIVCGPSGVEKFRKRRKSCQQKKSTGIVRECVPFFHACGSGGLSLNPAVDEALKLLESHYQEVVNIFQGMLSMNRATRLTATQAADQLNIYLRGVSLPFKACINAPSNHNPD